VYLNLAGLLTIAILIVVSTVLTKLMNVQLTPSLYGIMVHLLIHFAILALIMYISNLTDTLSIIISAIFYLSAFMMTVGYYQ